MPFYVDNINDIKNRCLRDYITNDKDESYSVDIRGDLLHNFSYCSNKEIFYMFGKSVSLKTLAQENWSFRLSCKLITSSLVLKLFNNKFNMCFRFKAPNKPFWDLQLQQVLFELADKDYFDHKVFTFGSQVQTASQKQSFDEVSTYDLLSIIEERYKKANTTWSKDLLNKKNIASVSKYATVKRSVAG